MISVTSRGFLVPMAMLFLATGALAQGSAQLALSASPAIGTVVQFQLTAPGENDRPFLLGLSLATSPGIPVGPGQVVPLAWDQLLTLSMTAPGLFGLSANTGLLNSQGVASVYWTIPNVASLVGFTVYAAYVTVDPFTSAVRAISPAQQITFQPAPAPPAPPLPVPPVLDPHQDLPGFVITILQLTGGSGTYGNFRVGDTITTRFKVANAGGTLLTIPDIDSVRILVSGPTFNYQRVIAQQSDVRARAILQPDGSYLYSFATALPATYIAPLNDTTFFGPGDGELTGQPLMNGTYTVGMEGYKSYIVEGVSYRDSDNTIRHFNIGTSTYVMTREVVKMENCNQCHTTLMVHGRNRKDVDYCVLCHTSGSEDRNTATVANGTPGVSIDFRVMIHRIHNGAHLPSVLGVTTNPDGSRNYAATPQPYEVMGFGNSLIDFSEVAFPVWPNLNIAMPRDQGYTSLGTTEKALEDTMRTGATACDKCHGDPDGTGPVTAPSQGANHWQKPSRRACGSCHDDVVWTQPYDANGQQMPPVYDDDSCMVCHTSGGSPLSTIDAHVHPLENPVVNPGFNVNVLAVTEAGIHNGNGRIDAGEKVSVSFTLTNDLGVAVPASTAGTSMSLVISGPTSNRQMVLSGSIVTAALGAGPIHTALIPEPVSFEYLGTSTAALETFGTARTAVWNLTGAAPSLFVRTATGFATYLASAAPVLQNFVDVFDASGIVRNDTIVVEDNVPGAREYLKVQAVLGNRLWFSSASAGGYKPAIAIAHPAGASVAKVTLTSKTLGTHYSLSTQTGLITELTEFGAGNDVLFSYTTDFVMPAVYGLTLNESPDLGEEAGKWKGKVIESGTYSLGLWGARTISLSLYGETNSYRGTAPGNHFDFLVGTATVVDPGTIVSSASNCNACHNDLYFHGGGRRGYDNCILCHGTAAAEDRPQFIAPNAPPTTGVRIEFREMLHKIHMGKELTQAATYTVNGFGSGAWPNNFTAYNYGEIGFPAMPDGVKACAKCHGAGNTAWQTPADRNHSTQQGVPVLGWRTVCASCHDDPVHLAHFQSNTTTNGVEACATCHGQGQTWELSHVHKVR